MENEDLTVTEGVTNPPQDTTALEQQITELVEVIRTEQELEAEEKALAEEEQAKELENAEKDATNLETMQTVIQTTSDSQTLALEGLIAEMQTMNAHMVVLHEKMDTQKEITVEASFTITLAICIVASVKIFIEQISKW